MSEPTCPECHHRESIPLNHWRTCSLITLECAKRYMEQDKEEIKRGYARVSIFITESHRWEHKFRTVKHENNKLRKKLAELITPPTQNQ